LRFSWFNILFSLSLLFIFTCGGGSSEEKRELNTNTTWYIQLQGEIDISKNVNLYDIDLFDASEEVIRKLKSQGKTVICYFNAGAYEPWRPDAGEFPDEVLGKQLEGWKEERWLDIRNPEVRKIMLNRLVLAKKKGCDGVDPDNVDGYKNDTGFNITYEDQLEYNKYIAEQAHSLGLLIGLKNDGEQVKDLVNFFDFSVQEECHQYGECHYYYPFIEQGKPVFNIEYNNDYVYNRTERNKLCNQAKKEGFMTAIYNLELDGKLFLPCW